jgi:hypothetical protein
MVLRLRYRTNLPSFTVKLLEPQPGASDREYSVPVAVRGKAAAWTELELPLASLKNEGVELVSSTLIREIRLLAAESSGKSPLLEVDSVQFLRRASR